MKNVLREREGLLVHSDATGWNPTLNDVFLFQEGLPSQEVVGKVFLQRLMTQRKMNTKKKRYVFSSN